MVRGWRKMHSEELHNLYSSPNIIRTIKPRIRWVKHVAHIGEKRNAYNISWECHKECLRCRWVNNIKTDFLRNKILWYGLDSSGSG
jgi:hypothetical protein